MTYNKKKMIMEYHRGNSNFQEKLRFDRFCWKKYNYWNVWKCTISRRGKSRIFMKNNIYDNLYCQKSIICMQKTDSKGEITLNNIVFWVYRKFCFRKKTFFIPYIRTKENEKFKRFIYISEYTIRSLMDNKKQKF